MKTKIFADFQICIGVPLTGHLRQVEKWKSLLRFNFIKVFQINPFMAEADII